MKKEIPKLIVIFLIVIGVVIWTLNYLFLSEKTAPRSRASGETVELSFDPSSSTAAANQDFFTTLKIKPSVDISLRGYLVNLVFDKSKLNLKKIEYKIGVASVDLGDSDSTLTTVNENGKTRLQGEVQTAIGQVIPSTAAVELVKLTFTAISTSGTTIQIGSSDVKFFIINSDMSLSEVPSSAAVTYNINGGGAIVSGTPAPTATPGAGCTSGNICLNLKLKFQGIIKKPADSQNSMTVKVKLQKQGESQPVEASGTFTANDQGLWSGKVGFNLVSVQGNYLLLIKGPQHIQKKICDKTPSETTAGIYRCAEGKISLTTGENTLDLSGIILLVGDLDQSGVVDSVDFSFVKNNLGKKEADILAKADLNRDGIVDTQDFSLILAALAIRTDEL
ncbi:MAG: dockerin type I domain-containing protein [Candidatus Roizmanbacteria bacterium]|nr:dockerin type I domain-containing protein [Candidatus Roizmanbacteria bacterium]